MVRFRYLVRKLRSAPLFTVVSVLTLGLGIGAATAIFSMVQGILLKPLPFPEPEELVSVGHLAPGLADGGIGVSEACYLTYRDQSRAFQDLALYSSAPLTVTGGEQPERVRGLRVTDGFLVLLRTRPHLGRFFSERDDRPGGGRTVVLSHGYWKRKFSADPSVIESQIRIDGLPWTVIGVLPAGFGFLNLQPDLLIPYRIDPSQAMMANFSHRGLARLKPGAGLEAAAADIQRMIPLATERFTRGMNLRMLREAGFAPHVLPLKAEVVGDAGEVLWILLAAVGIVLLIACANVANLFLVRTQGRRREFGVRRALGAGRLDVAKEITFETSALALAGGAMGVMLADAAISLLKRVEPGNLPRVAEISFDAKVLLFALSASLLTAAACASLPLLGALRLDVVKSLKGASRGVSEPGRRHRVRNALVASQIALALTLLIGSGLILRSFNEMLKVEPGFERPEDVLTMRVYVPEAVLPDASQVAWAHRRILESILEVAGVQAAGVVSTLPMAQEGYYDDFVEVEEFPIPTGRMPPGRRFKWISPGYLDSMGIPLMSGRAFEWNDIHNASPVVLVNEAFARRYWADPGRAVGKRIKESLDRNWREIIGVVGDVRDEGLTEEPEPTIYWPLMVADMWGRERFILRSLAYAIRADQSARAALADRVREAVWSVNGSLAVANMKGLDAVVARSRAQMSFALVMLAIAAAGALLLAVVGVYGVISHAASQRTREIGIRAALGADRRKIRALILRHGLAVTALGVLFGLGFSVLLTRWMSSLLFRVGGLDPPTYLAVTAILAAVALAAAYLPARRAARLNPIDALRWE